MKHIDGNKATHVCPCGHFGDEGRECRCSPGIIARYQSRVSGPFLDRFDIQVTVSRLDLSELRKRGESGESSATVQERVVQSRAIQLQRAGKANARLSGTEIEAMCGLSRADNAFLEQAMQRLQLSMRAYARILKTARTIADMAAKEDIGRKHLLEALAFRESLQR